MKLFSPILVLLAVSHTPEIKARIVCDGNRCRWESILLTILLGTTTRAPTTTMAPTTTSTAAPTTTSTAAPTTTSTKALTTTSNAVTSTISNTPTTTNPSTSTQNPSTTTVPTTQVPPKTCAATTDFKGADGNYFISSCFINSLSTFDDSSKFCTASDMTLLWLDPSIKDQFFTYASTLIDETNKSMWIDDGSETCSMMMFHQGVFTTTTKSCTEPARSFCEFKKFVD